VPVLWRRSLLTRVVLTTLVVSGVVVALFTTLLLDSVGRGLVSAKQRASLVDARAGAVLVESAVDQADADTAPARLAAARRAVEELDARGAAGELYGVALRGPESSPVLVSAGTTAADLPVLGTGGTSQYTYSPATVFGQRAESLIVGELLDVRLGGEYRLYFAFPLTSEQQTLDLVRRTALVAGLLLVGLLVLTTGVVARQVVAPVRLAARTAERLAAGRLDERMRVRGEDEIARLGTTFNSMAAALQSQIRQLEELSRVQRRFVSDVSHELRTPLTTVRMAADVLYDARADFPRSSERSAELLQNELDRFESMLTDLLEISRYDAGAADLDASPVDVSSLVRRVVEAAEPLAERKGCAVEMQLPHRPAIAEVDARRIERALRNLVVNAVEHSEARPVRITLSSDAAAVVVRVRDHGVGLTAGQAGMVFTRFWRGDPSRARTTGGTGLGLAIALEDVRLHNGWLQAAGEPGRGAVFRMTLPRAAGSTVPDTPLVLR